MDIQTFAPVLIPTLNRYEHFKRCLESLEKCTYADQTDVYIALDYPPSEQYKNGWIKIASYLQGKEKVNGFKKLEVIHRNHNYGVGHMKSNGILLVNEIMKTYDRYIFTEDDNEFSPCFLDYMNKNLERFKDDPRINLVCGYNYVMDFPTTYKNNFYLSKGGCPWGTGEWTGKRKQLLEYYDHEKLCNVLKQPETLHLLPVRSPKLIRVALSMIKSGELWGDSIKGIFAAIHDTYCIMPRESMVRNYGNDGTGEHSKSMNTAQNDYYSTQSISTAKTFDYTDDIFTYEPLYLERHLYKQKMTPYLWLRKIHADLCFSIDWFLFTHFDYLPKSRWI